MASRSVKRDLAPLAAHARETKGLHLRDLFAEDPGRAGAFSLEAGDLFLDYSKNRVTAETMRLLFDLARKAGLEAEIGAMFAGEKINRTEGRAVLHVALRDRARPSSRSTARTSCRRSTRVLDRMGEFADRVRSGTWTGHTGRRIRNVVNIGIGGSDLGPAMACEALQALQRPRRSTCASCRTSTARISRRRCATWTRPRRCSSSRRRPSRRRRP